VSDVTDPAEIPDVPWPARDAILDELRAARERWDAAQAVHLDARIAFQDAARKAVLAARRNGHARFYSPPMSELAVAAGQSVEWLGDVKYTPMGSLVPGRRSARSV